ncbi:GntR family transcriptional regulator [Pseudodonghicola xiamenensis]|uniref:GntR family transcriptional regulator n=1 Tax=Pseudodonghicola xiamenensis TaxID=337702 RepID=A0A8J3ME25_9RHOB|nr:GntR family transcriptional regulator [Pseudodonghicola xiamenensis]GHH02348.1 GntR family transcriptional regulator [Pseudodonghicola xiamenensis]
MSDDQSPEPQIFETLQPADLASRVADQVLRAIGDGRLRPGEKVADARLARELGTSRAPVREGLRLLESQGLIVSHPRRGFFVHAYDADELKEVYDLRECLELHAAEAAVARMTKADCARLEAQVQKLYDLADEGQTQEQVVQDFAFHRMLCELGGNSRILRLFDQIAAELRAGIALVGQLYDDPEEIARSHDPLIKALRARDPARLRAELHEHLQDAQIHVVQLFRTGAFDLTNLDKLSDDQRNRLLR